MPDRWRLAALCVCYALVMLYASTIVGPDGMHFVYRDPAEAFRVFLATPYVPHGSDQRADWVGNLLMLVPFGFLVAASMRPRRSSLRLPAALLALLTCVATILFIKYLQLFFPPRTVTLNYILAQSIGALVGCAGYAVCNARIGRSVGRQDRVWALVLALRLYAGTLFVFILMPLDFALSATDLATQIGRIPETLLALPGSGRPLAVRLAVIVVASAAFVPVGMLLRGRGVGPGGGRWRSVLVRGLLLTTGLYALSLLVISATPALAAVLYRTAGIMAGAAMLDWVVRQDTGALRQQLRRWSPWLALAYLVGVLLVNRLLSWHWLSWSQAVAQAYMLGLIPLFDYYIVTKAAAAKNVVGHVVLYLPVGALLWMRYGEGVAGRAFVFAAALSSLVEVARYFRPGLEGDINAVVLAGVAAAAAARLMPSMWGMIQSLQRQAAASRHRGWSASIHAPGPKAAASANRHWR